MTGSLGHIEWGTDLITFFGHGYWDLPASVSLDAWSAMVERDPRPYFERMLDGAAEAGLTAVELAPGAGGWTKARRAYGDAATFGKALSARGLRLGSSYEHASEVLIPPLEDPTTAARADAHIDAHAQFIRACGANIIVLSTIPRSEFPAEPGMTVDPEGFAAPVPAETMERVAAQLNHLGAIAAKHGVRIALHTDAWSVCARAADIATLMSLTDPDNVLLCPDTGHLTLDGQDAVEILRQNVKRVPLMHWKDCIAAVSPHTVGGDGGQRHAVMMANFRLPGTGLMHWREWVQVLDAAAWNGWAMIEEDLAPDAVAAIRQSVSYLKGEIQELRLKS